MTIQSCDYLAPLQQWLKPALKSVFAPADNPDLACYGPGNHGHWAQQSNTTAFTAFAVMAADPDYAETEGGISRAALLKLALKMLRFTLRSHKAGGGVTFDGKPWGRSWISPLCLERMMAGVDAIDKHLTTADWKTMQDVFESECDYLIDEYEVVADIDANTGRNHPESNIWNGAILQRTVLLFPETRRASEYQEWATRYLLNGISIPADKNSARLYAGKPLSHWHEGANFTENFGLHHHGYLNVGYMVICLSNIAMLHFSYRRKNLRAPEELYHHARELWKLIKMFTFSDGRLWRIGGDSRVRYCYCQDYAIPMWLLALDEFGDSDAELFENGWLDIVQTEQANNGDGSFMSERLAELEEVSPLYFARLEGDKAATLAMGAYWRRICNEFNNCRHENISAPSDWSDKFHGALAVKSEKRLASFSWQASQRPMAMCVPANDSSLAEWRWNMVGEIRGTSAYVWTNPLSHHDTKFTGGFNTCGKFEWWAGHHVAEGQADELTALEHIAFAALPDDATVIVLQQAATAERVYLKEVKGLLLNVPNDIFNGKTRTYTSGSNINIIEGCSSRQEVLTFPKNTVLVDDRLKIELVNPEEKLSLHRPGRRQAELYNADRHTQGRSGGNLYSDEICSPCLITRNVYPANTLLFDTAAVITVETQLNTQAKLIDTGSRSLKALALTGADGREYLFIANFAEAKKIKITNPFDKELRCPGNNAKTSGTQKTLEMTLDACESVLLVAE